jgi:hypothetical protein
MSHKKVAEPVMLPDIARTVPESGDLIRGADERDGDGWAGHR